jgi:hypothetical protein
MKTYGGLDAQIYVFLTSALVVGEWSASPTVALPSSKKVPDTQWIGGLVGPRAGLDDMEKRRFFTLTGLQLQHLSCPVHRQ